MCTVSRVTSKAAEWSAKYRNWSYYPTFVVPPQPEGAGLEGVQLTDCGVVYELSERPGAYYMTYITYDGIGYQTALATSEDTS